MQTIATVQIDLDALRRLAGWFSRLLRILSIRCLTFFFLVGLASAASGQDSRAICGQTVTSASYTGTFPSWLDGTAEIYGWGTGGTIVFLGVVSNSEFAANSILNQFGLYGSRFQTNSIFNSFGTYGGSFGGNSACNSYSTASAVPQIWRNGLLIGYLTKNSFVSGAIDPVVLVAALLKQTYGVAIDLTAPSIPSGVIATVVSSTQINLNWNASADNVGVVAYRVYVNGTLVNTFSASTLGITHTGLQPATTYSYTVAACDAAGNCSAQSNAVSATTLAIADTQAPTAPAGVSATSTSSSRVNLTWTASTDNVGVTSYKVYRGGALVGSPSGTSYSNTGLTASTLYSYTVAACDAAGNCSAQSAAVSATTHAAVVTALNFAANWNLAGNSVTAPLTVATTFADATNISTVWKWVPATGKWAFYTPTLTDGGAAYAATKGYDFLTTINGGEGFWVNAKVAFTAQLPAGTSVGTSYFQDQSDPAQNKLRTGWNLIATGDGVTPSAFNQALSLTPPAQGPISVNVTTLWAWDATRVGWYFWAPSLVNSGTLAGYLSSKGYLDFATLPGTPAGILSPTTGFWVNKP